MAALAKNMLRPLRFLLHGLQAKPRVALAVGLGVFAATAVYTFTRPRIYEATAVFASPVRTPVKETAAATATVDAVLVCGDGINTLRFVAESAFITRKVAQGLSPNDITGVFSLPHRKTKSGEDELVAILGANRRVTPGSMQTTLLFSFRHLRPEGAAHIANSFAGALLAFLERTESDQNRQAAEYLRLRAEQERTKATAIRETLAELAGDPTAFANKESLPATSPSLSTRVSELEHELQLNRDLVAQLEARLREIEQPPAVRRYSITPATPPGSDEFVSPDIRLLLGFGLLAGILLGASAAAFVARPIQA